MTIGGVPAEVLWAGLVGPGLYQINVRVPASVADGNQAVVASVAGVSSQSTALLKVAASAKLSARGRSERLLAKLLGQRDPLEDPRSGTRFGRAGLDELMWLAALAGPAQHTDGSSHLAQVSLEAAEEQGGLIQLVEWQS
jgi:hypothetical protein